jgi:uncharacterized protein YjdB/acyl carrier protein
MGRITTKKRICSLLLAVLMAFTGLIPAATVFAADGVEGYYDIELFYKDSDTLVPSYQSDGSTAYIEYMYEGDELNLTYKLIDTEMPDNAYIKWYSETPTLVDVTQDGVVKAFDSSKGAVVQTWIDNEVKTIPLVGTVIAKVLQKALFNDYVDLDSMDTEEIVNLVEEAFGSDSVLDKYIESYEGDLVDSLRTYLDNVNSNIHVQLYSSDGTLLDDDYVQVCVLKSTEWYANFLPNGTHITNKDSIATTVAAGSTVQLQAVTTPLRLNYGVIYSVKSTSVFSTGKVVATVNDSGLVTFKNTGTVTIMASPDTEDVIEGILKLVNYVYTLDNTGTLDTQKVADILIKYVGIDMNRVVLAAILDVCFAVKDIVGDSADPVQLTATAVEIIANLVLQFVYNDSITFTVVDAEPITNFSISGATSVQEGAQIQLSITDLTPSTGDTSDIVWSSSNPEIASVDPSTGIITGRDAGGSLGSFSTQKCTITATSTTKNVVRSYNITVTGKTGKYLSDVEIEGPSYLEIGQDADYTYAVYPNRVATADNLYISWGVKTGTDDDGNATYTWADSENPATDGIGQIDAKGHYTIVDGGTCTIAVKATTGYYLASGNFYEISSYTSTYDVTNGIPVDSITISATGATSNGTLSDPTVVTIDGQDYTYITIEKGVGEGYAYNGAIFSASVYPENASNQTLNWVVDNTYYNSSTSDDTHTLTVKQQANHENADTFNVYAVSEDGRIKSNVITVCITRNRVVSNVIDQDSITIVNGQQADATHTIGFDGSWTSTAYACYKCNWYSSDESVFTVVTKTNDNRDATLTAVDVGTATLYCVTADGGIVATCQVTVTPDKERLQNIVDLCDRTIIKRTSENKTLYSAYMKKLDLAYYVLYDEPMASQMTCDTYADELLYALYKVGGFVSVSDVNITNNDKSELTSDHVTVKVGSTTNYTKYSYDFGYVISPSTAMYSDVKWTSSNSSISVDKNGLCKPTSNDPCSAIITCTVIDYMGNEVSDSVYLTFARTVVTGISLDTTQIVDGPIGDTQTLTATVQPKGIGLGTGAASCKDVYWSSSNENVATVDQNGVVTFVAGGDCIITCTTYDGGYTAQCAVNVVTNYSALQLLITQYSDLGLNSVNYYPDTWETYSNAMTKAQNMVANGGYSQDAVDAMTAELETAYNGLKKYNYIQKVELYLDGEQTADFYQYDLSLLNGEWQYTDAVLDLNVRLYPNNGSYKTVTWESSTTDISVTSEGKCSPTAKKSCYGMITCTVTDHFGNEFSDSVWVSFARYPVTSLALSETSITGSIGSTQKLTCTIYPTGTSIGHIGAASIQDFYWESDNEDIATVDENGEVTFVSAGSTVVRAVSYDGGISAECVVSCEGDRSVLRSDIEQYKDVDYTQYEYSYGMSFKEAYEAAVSALNDTTVTQDDIDTAVANLEFAYGNLADHPFVQVSDIDISYTTYKKKLPTSSGDAVESGTVSSNDALSVNISGYTNYNTYNFVTLTSSVAPTNAMYSSIEWSVDSSYKVKSSISDNAITLTPSETKIGAWAIVTATVTDQYGRTYTRTISVVLSDNTTTGFDILGDETSIYVTSSGRQLVYTIDGSPEFTTVNWTSSNEDVLTVDENGYITPVERGTAVITGKTLDGGYTDSIVVTVNTDFTALVAKQDEYSTLIEQVQDSYVYTSDSLDALQQVVSESQEMINENSATQAEVEQMIEKLDNAYNSLVKYVATTGVKIGYTEESNVTSVNDGFIRYTGTVSLNNKTLTLVPIVDPDGSVYTDITWTSSNDNISVDENGVVTSNTANASVAKITCTVKNVFGSEFTDSVYVSFVRSGATGISFKDEMVYGAPAQTVKVSPTITNANNSSLSSLVVKDCIYSSSDESIATVDNDGNVTFVSQGEAVITATALDGGYTATITAYTTWDTTALSAAIDVAKAINYTDYAYDYGTAFKSAYDDAVTVYANIYASQAEIDSACNALTEATSALEGNEFIVPEISAVQGENVLENGSYVNTDENGNATVDVVFNDGAMVKSVEVTTSDENGVTTQVSGTQINVVKTADKGTFSFTVNVVDDYGREYTKSYSLNVIETQIPATSITLTADGEAVSGTVVRSCGGSYTKYAGLTIGYITTPENANSIVDVTYTSSATDYIKVDENGAVTLTTFAKARTSNTAVITCTVTNLDGTTATNSVTVTITRS